MKIAESELVINTDGSAFHIHVKPEHLADKVVLVGDPGRVGMFRPLLTDIESDAVSREFAHITGRYKGCRVTILSTGIGTDNIDIVMTELDALANIDFTTREIRDVHRTLEILRIGTCGAVQPDIPVGSYIFSDISIGFDGVLNWYADVDRIRLADFEKAFLEHCHWDKRLAVPYFVRAGKKISDKFSDIAIKGMTVSAPGFYGPQGRVIRIGLAMPGMLEEIGSFIFQGYRVTNFEMESSAIAGLAAHLGHQAGTVCCAIANRYVHDMNTDYKPQVQNLVALSLDRLCSD